MGFARIQLAFVVMVAAASCTSDERPAPAARPTPAEPVVAVPSIATAPFVATVPSAATEPWVGTGFPHDLRVVRNHRLRLRGGWASEHWWTLLADGRAMLEAFESDADVRCELSLSSEVIRPFGTLAWLNGLLRARAGARPYLNPDQRSWTTLEVVAFGRRETMAFQNVADEPSMQLLAQIESATAWAKAWTLPGGHALGGLRKRLRDCFLKYGDDAWVELLVDPQTGRTRSASVHHIAGRSEGVECFRGAAMQTTFEPAPAPSCAPTYRVGLGRRSWQPSTTEARTGYLDVYSRAMIEVSLDGQPLGRTPVRRFEVGVGPHLLTIHDPARATHRRIAVVIEPNESEVLLLHREEPSEG